VDIVIVTIRDDEYTAVLDRLPDRDVDARARRTYWTAKVPNRHGVAYEVAVVRTTEKGQSAAQETTHDAIEDLDPSWILLVGIAGGSPDPGFTLGDVVVATRLHAFIVGTKLEGRELQLDDQGEPMAPVIEDFVGFLPSLRDDMAGWETRAAIKARRPFVDLQSSHFYGPTEWQERTRLALERNKDRRKPIFTTGPVASGDLLVKDTQLLAGWQSSAHDVAAVEMELAGVCRAARRRDRQYPVLAIRGISDIVGFKRTPDWTTYACHTAASFALRLLAMMPVDFLAPKSFPPVHKR
jgi:nucleoside phosphorylase